MDRFPSPVTPGVAVFWESSFLNSSDLKMEEGAENKKRVKAKRQGIAFLDIDEFASLLGKNNASNKEMQQLK